MSQTPANADELRGKADIIKAAAEMIAQFRHEHVEAILTAAIDKAIERDRAERDAELRTAYAEAKKYAKEAGDLAAKLAEQSAALVVAFDTLRECEDYIETDLKGIGADYRDNWYWRQVKAALAQIEALAKGTFSSGGTPLSGGNGQP